jgi:hypothetical protein
MNSLSLVCNPEALKREVNDTGELVDPIVPETDAFEYTFTVVLEFVMIGTWISLVGNPIRMIPLVGIGREI